MKRFSKRRCQRLAMSMALVLGISTALVSCASAPAQVDRYYRPTPALPAPAASALKARIIVEPFEVHGLYSDRPLVYVDATGAYRQSNHSHWIEPPSILLAAGLLDVLRAAYGSEAAFLPEARLSGDLTIRTRLRRFERLPESVPAQALLSLEMIVSDRGGHLVGSIDFDERSPAGSTIPEYVQAQSRLFDAACTRLLALLDARAAAPSVTR